jgi:class 3 adenylate cyclase/tetratricopeptide (TPR) repeat protein
VAVCSQCGRQNADDARFCSGCAAPLLAEPTPPPAVRKVVTVLFCDLVDSTPLGERLDPEALRRVLARWHKAMRTVIERHGGTVEKFVGDAVMAVFGLPLAHEDDALRAVRAAAEMRVALAALNAELERNYAVAIESRTALNTGEVVASRGETLVTGDAVNVAARLEQTAPSGEILLGEPTYELVRDVTLAEPVAELALKGKAQPVTAWRLLSVLPDIPVLARPRAIPFVGREHELAALEAAFGRAATERSCRLVTVLGEPGIGKSRLTQELLISLGANARVLVGRCLPYGERITYRPLVEILEQIAGSEPYVVVTELMADDENAELIAELVASVPGFAERKGSSDETYWAVRRLFEALARERPLLVVLEDLHWAEATLLDLVEYVFHFAADVPILLVALARTELLETRPSLATTGPKSELISLEPLGEPEIETLIDRLAESRELPADVRTRIVEVAEGNPLFVEQLLAMRADPGGDELAIPPTIQAVLAARIDRLEAGQRAVIERASVEGRGFHRGAVVELLPEPMRAEAEAHLLELVRKGLIRPDRAAIPGEDGFRFAHVLIRDTAYGSVSKELRSDLHERLARWLQGTVGEQASEFEEILGFHLEQAYRYRIELGPIDKGALALAKRATDRLASAGRRALARGDFPAAAGLLGRALLLVRPDDPHRGELLTELGWILGWTERVRAEAILTEAVGVARAQGDRRLELLASLRRAYVGGLIEPEGSREELLRFAEQAIPVFERLGDERGLTEAWKAVAYFHKATARYGPEAEALGRALAHARRAGAWREERVIMAMRLSRLISGPSPLSEAVRAYNEVLKQVGDDLPLQAEVSIRFAWAQAMRGRLADARALDKHGWTLFEELGLAETHAVLSHYSGSTYLLAGDPTAAGRRLRWGYGVLAGGAESAVRSGVAGLLAEALYVQGRLEECEHFTKISEETAASDDVWSQIMWRSARAKVLATLGEPTRADRLAREGVALAEDTDSPDLRGNALMDQAEVLRLAGSADDGAPLVEKALRLYDQKGNVVSAGKARNLLAELRQGTSARAQMR